MILAAANVQDQGEVKAQEGTLTDIGTIHLASPSTFSLTSQGGHTEAYANPAFAVNLDEVKDRIAQLYNKENLRNINPGSSSEA